MATEAPDRSLQQRRDALQKANRIRSYRKTLKEQIKDRRVSLADLLEAPPDDLVTAKVYDLLLAVPGWGPTKAKRMLEVCRASRAKTVGGLSDRQRRDIARRLHTRHYWPIVNANCSIEQREEAMRLANVQRLALASLRRAIKTGILTVPDALETMPNGIASLTIGDLLSLQRRWGPWVVGRFLRPLFISDTRLVTKLTERQRKLIAYELRFNDALWPVARPDA